MTEVNMLNNPSTQPVRIARFAEYICTKCNLHVGVGYGAVSERGFGTLAIQGFATSKAFLLPFQTSHEVPVPTDVVHVERGHCIRCS